MGTLEIIVAFTSPFVLLGAHKHQLDSIATTY